MIEVRWFSVCVRLSVSEEDKVFVFVLLQCNVGNGSVSAKEERANKKGSPRLLLSLAELCVV